ncbi:MAG TPA: c-type cytochrome [Aggregatilineales bacterium]|nr:cytochrome c [Anaerolineales bacterium]HRE47459.1 c-type cytochrome [Aggregatilineales bacterium]
MNTVHSSRPRLWAAFAILSLVLMGCGSPGGVTVGNLTDATATPPDPYVVAWLLYGTPTPGFPGKLPVDAGVAYGENAPRAHPTVTPLPPMVSIELATATPVGAATAATPVEAATAAPPESPSPESPSGAALTGDPKKGQSVFAGVGTCSACHDVKAGKTLVGPTLKGIAVTAAERVPGMDATTYLREAILQPNKFVVKGFTAGLMPASFEQLLSAKQVDDLLAYLMSLK